jgi:serine/threonine protein kinase
MQRSQAPRACNEDFVGMVTPGKPVVSAKGLIAAIADGVSGNAGGHESQTLQQHLDTDTHFTVPETIAHGIKLVHAVGALHRRSTIHRNIKPANVHLGDNGELRLLDLGVAQSGLEAGSELRAPQAGTPSFLAPEQFDDAPPSRQTDLYSTGMTLYFMLARRYPYGENKPFQHPRFGTPVPPTRYRPDIPVWFENVLLKAVARNPTGPFEAVEEFLLALERGATRPFATPAVKPLAQRDPLLMWRAVSIASVVVNLLLLYLIAAR